MSFSFTFSFVTRALVLTSLQCKRNKSLRESRGKRKKEKINNSQNRLVFNQFVVRLQDSDQKCCVGSTWEADKRNPLMQPFNNKFRWRCNSLKTYYVLKTC